MNLNYNPWKIKFSSSSSLSSQTSSVLADCCDFVQACMLPVLPL